MPRPRKRYSAEFKSKIALEAIKGQKTTNELAAEYGVHPNQIAQWKKQALDELPSLFTHGADQASARDEKLVASL